MSLKQPARSRKSKAIYPWTLNDKNTSVAISTAVFIGVILLSAISETQKHHAANRAHDRVTDPSIRASEEDASELDGSLSIDSLRQIALNH